MQFVKSFSSILRNCNLAETNAAQEVAGCRTLYFKVIRNCMVFFLG